MSDSEYSSFTSNPKVAESYSLFGDGSYGEPLVAQHLVVNFTPLQDVDNDFVQKKCCAFWDFVNSRPELQKLLVLPESNVYRTNFETSEKDSSLEVRPLKKVEPVTNMRTAVSMLEIVEEKGLIDRTFEAKLPQSHCSLGSREYHQNEITVALDKTKPDQEECICSGSCIACSKRRPSEASPAAVDLCRKMEAWENKHPKSMDPPGHPPVLSRCIMQRK